jgi:hypothetical protein
MKDAKPVRPGKFVDGAEPVRVACQYPTLPEHLLYAANLGSPFYKVKSKVYKIVAFSSAILKN